LVVSVDLMFNATPVEDFPLLEEATKKVIIGAILPTTFRQGVRPTSEPYSAPQLFDVLIVNPD